MLLILFVQPSTSELQSLVILEAMSCCLPIIGSNCGPIPELVNQGVNGILFEPCDYVDLREKIIFLLNNEPLRGKMQTESLKMVQKHSLTMIGEEFIKVYKEIL